MKINKKKLEFIYEKYSKLQKLKVNKKLLYNVTNTNQTEKVD